MSIECAHCGTLLIGTVNRCWKCGQNVSAAAPQSAAELRSQQEQVAKFAPGVAEAMAQPPAEELAELAEHLPDSSDSAAPSDAGTPPLQPAAAAAESAPPKRIDAASEPAVASSPFADPASGSIYSAPPKTQYPRNIANAVGGYLALLLGIGSVVEAFYVPIASVFTALVGLACGLWGVKSNRRVSSSIGMALCCFALAWGGFNAAVGLYTHYTGRNPFAPNVVQELDEEDPFADEFDGDF